MLGTFRPERIKAIAARFGIDQDAALENILFARAYTSEHQMELIVELAARFSEEKGIYRLLVSNSRNTHILSLISNSKDANYNNKFRRSLTRSLHFFEATFRVGVNLLNDNRNLIQC